MQFLTNSDNHKHVLLHLVPRQGQPSDVLPKEFLRAHTHTCAHARTHARTHDPVCTNMLTSPVGTPK